jgi:hypothetical protein
MELWNHIPKHCTNKLPILDNLSIYLTTIESTKIFKVSLSTLNRAKNCSDEKYKTLFQSHKYKQREKIKKSEIEFIKILLKNNCFIKSGSCTKKFSLIGNKIDLYVEYLNEVNNTDFKKRSYKTFLKIINNIGLKKMNVFDLNFCCFLCIKGKLATKELNYNKNLIEEDKKKFISWKKDYDEHIDIVYKQKKDYDNDLKEITDDKEICIMDFTCFNSAIIDFVLVVVKKIESKYEYLKFHFIADQKNELSQNHEFVQFCLSEFIKERGKKEFIFWSDGCAS